MKKLISDNKKTGIQFIKFSLIGFLNTGIHYGIFLLLFRFFGIHYLIASGIGYCAGVINSFILNKLWTFKTKGTRKDVEFAKFVVVNMVSLAINVGSLKFFVAFVGMRPELGRSLQ
jgi:putative flippase GtrA